MSEPTSGAPQKPGSEPEQDREVNNDPARDQHSEFEFNDPTAPDWSAPTESRPEPPAPTPPGPAPARDDIPAPHPQETQRIERPQSNPYAQQPPQALGQQPPPAPYGQQPPAPYAQQPAPQPYGQQQPPTPYGQQQPPRPYGQPQPYGQPEPAPQYTPQYGDYSQQSYANNPEAPANTSAIVLTVVSGISLFVGNVLAIASLVLGIVALTKNTADHDGSRRLTKIGWIVFAVSWAVGILVVIGAIVLFAASLSDVGTSTNFGG